MTMKIFKKDAKDDLMVKILQCNFSKVLGKILEDVYTARTLTYDAPDEMPKEDREKLLKFLKDTETAINNLI